MNNLKLSLNYCLAIVFSLAFITGLVKFPEFNRYFGFVYDHISASQVSFLHDYSGLVLVVLILIHIFLFNRKKLFRLPEVKDKKTLGRLILYSFLIVLIVFVAIGYYDRLRRDLVLPLGTVEITNYQGEKLDSINDFRENSIKGPQTIDEKSYALVVTGLVDQERRYSYDDILALKKYQKVVALDCVEGWQVNILWSGTLVQDIIAAAGVKPTANTIIFYAVDGYSTSFPLEYIRQKNIIMADKMNGVKLPPARGFPFQLIAEDKWGYKWIKWITKIELSDDVNYKGYWESRGYNNNGDLKKSQF